jgi:hypothetical protein
LLRRLLGLSVRVEACGELRGYRGRDFISEPLKPRSVIFSPRPTPKSRGWRGELSRE